MSTTDRTVDQVPGSTPTLTSATDEFYERNAGEYFAATVSADMSAMHDRFLAMLPPGGRILDAGCGSGRDLRAFTRAGFHAIGLDASPTLVELARSYSGASCTVGRLEDMTYENCFDGVWACASLLHLRREVLPGVLRRIHAALVPRGVLYASVQQGQGDQETADGRFFALYQPAEFGILVRNAGFELEKSFSTPDVLHRNLRTDWLNVLAKADKGPGPSNNATSGT